jgi:hypothetical protein
MECQAAHAQGKEEFCMTEAIPHGTPLDAAGESSLPKDELETSVSSSA